MFTSKETDASLSTASAERRILRVALLAGLTVPLVLLTLNRLAIGVAPHLPGAGAQTAAEEFDGPLIRSFAGTRYGLHPSDVARYRRIFSAADLGQWKVIDDALPALGDRRLVGHVLATRYLMADAQPAFADLRSWLDLYGDLPEADDIYRLALNGQPREATVTLPAPHNSPAANSETVKQDPDSTGSAEPRTNSGERAISRFFSADDKGALLDATQAAAALGEKASTSLWIAGLSAWRMGNFAEAARNFNALTASHSASDWMLAAGSYWAARVEEHNGASAAAAKLFQKASTYPLTFYGMLAMRKLGLDIAQEISTASLTPEHLDTLAETPAGYRAVALLQIGRRDLAAQELEQVDPAGNPKMEAALILVADAAHLGDISSILAQRIAQPATTATQHFPIPAWKPRGGFRIDPALVYAVARQESRFDPSAISRSGAAGLMQIMPGTANAIAPNQAHSLLDPSTNLDLGQRYLDSLMQDPNIGENLLLLAVAYNAGAGNPAKFQDLLNHDDPLLAIESIKTGETRTFIQRVLANYWIYRARLGGDTSSLTDLADGRWPRYHWNNASDDITRSLGALN
jgi:soluble lytic murein transglycosylase-like protein